MKHTKISIVLQVTALLFLIIIGYLTFRSSTNWKIISSELNKAQKKINTSKDAIAATQSELENFRVKFEQMKTQKDLIIHKRDSLILSFQRKNAKDWTELQRIKDSIKLNTNRLVKDRVVLNSLFGLKE